MKEANIVTLTEQKKITSKLEENKDGYIYVRSHKRGGNFVLIPMGEIRVHRTYKISRDNRQSDEELRKHSRKWREKSLTHLLFDNRAKLSGIKSTAETTTIIIQTRKSFVGSGCRRAPGGGGGSSTSTSYYISIIIAAAVTCFRLLCARWV